MTQQPLTEAGVQNKQDELYALSDNLLEEQVNLIRNDFKNWLKDNFTLDSAQEAYLDAMNDQFLELASAETGISTKYKLPVYMIKPTPSGLSKLVKVKSTIVTTLSSSGLSATGSLTFEIHYV